MKNSSTFTRFSAALLVLCFLFAVTTSSLAMQQGRQQAGEVEFTPELYSQIMVTFAPGVNIEKFSRDHGLTVERKFHGVDNVWLFNAPSVARATELTSQLRNFAGVVSAFQDQSTGYTPNSFVPNDPFFNNPVSPNNFGGQWHLGNNVSGVPHVNIAGAWANNFTGSGVMMGIIDAGVEPGHEDLSAGFSAANTFDFFANTATQNMTSGDVHGTAVAGVSAARGGNGIGVTGAAPFAGIGSQKVFQGSSSASSAAFANATLFNSTGANPSIHVKNHSYGISTGYISTPGEVSAIATSAAAGTVHVVSAGNDRGTSGTASASDSNRKHLQSAPGVINVAALGSNGLFSSYSCFGANVFVTAPSNSFTAGTIGITTTDRTGTLGYNSSGSGDYSNRNYTSTFGGTSSAAPLVAGIMALGKQANPNMDVRLAKHALARTSVIVNALDATATSDGGWKTNTAGFVFNQNYGFGVIHATNFVNMVQTNGVTPLVTAATSLINVGTAIPDNNVTGLTRTATNTTAGLMEEVMVTLNIAHLARGDIEAFLTSPSGTVGRLTYRSTVTTDNINWTFLSNAFWGEQALGTWSVNVRDVTATNTGTWTSFQVQWNMGTMLAIPEPGTIAPLVILLILNARRRIRS